MLKGYNDNNCNIVSNNSNLAIKYSVTLLPENIYNNNKVIDKGEIELLKDFNNKELINSYTKNGFVVKSYKPIMSVKERTCKDSQIKYDVINIIKNLTSQKKWFIIITYLKINDLKNLYKPTINQGWYLILG